MKKQTSFITLSLMLATPALAGGAGAPAARPATAACQNIAQIVMADPNFSTLATAVEAAGLGQTLTGGQYTVFAPTNAAFAKLPSDALAMVLNDPAMLRAVLLYHVVPGKVTAKQVMGMSMGKTAQGGSFMVTVSGGKVMIDNATVTKADVMACNGIVHVIDTVLMPAMDTAMQPAAPAAAAPAPAPAPAVTVSAPAATATDIMSIPALPLSGGSVTTTTTTTTETATTTETTTEASGEMMAEGTTLYDMIVADERFSTLRDLLSDAELTEVLMSNDYTVFAPTNEAFEGVDPDQLALIASNPDTLKQVLLYHVVSGKLNAEDLKAGTQLRSAEGTSLDLSMEGTSVMVNTAMIDGAAVTASNGNIFAINEVLLPETLVLPDPPTGEEVMTDTATADTTTTDTTAATTATTTTATVTTTAVATTGNALVDALSQPQFSTLLSLVQKADLVGALTAADVTVFAPTNDAFAKVPQATLDALMADPAKLRQVLTYHVVAGRVVDDGLKVTQLRSLEGSSIDLKVNGTTYTVGNLSPANAVGSTVANRIDAGTSVIYPIDMVMLPPTLQ